MTDNEELSLIRLAKAYETLKEAETLINADFWNGAVNRIYYACFYAVNGLLIKHGFEPITHTGVKQLFGLHFVSTNIISKQLGKFYSTLFNKRMLNDYDDFVNIEREAAIDFFSSAKELISEIESLIKNK